ncbi:Hypothetical protein NTJ_03514 [Nesidiocoris tenuis]|uniref:Uncharacterized protein n=1 Tax=Nesidiocoris tenuis TaxID=355587 RepID=A0ABN7AIK3_9HEMI|nr:Hypothetical protein NTJ_03514 [Nesidiocoris tenuis]
MTRDKEPPRYHSVDPWSWASFTTNHSACAGRIPHFPARPPHRSHEFSPLELGFSPYERHSSHPFFAPSLLCRTVSLRSYMNSPTH